MCLELSKQDGRGQRAVRSTAWRVACLLLVACGPAALTAWWHPSAPGWTVAGEAEDVVWFDPSEVPEEVMWLDAREPAAWAAGGLPGALPLSETGWEEDLVAVVSGWEPGRWMVVYCDGAGCEASVRVARRLQAEFGFEEVGVLRGGYAAWLEGRALK